MLEKLQKSKYCGEVPATKLAALQKVLQSEFLNAVREVYEHVYETVDVQGNPEIRASATAKVWVFNASLWFVFEPLGNFDYLF